jgi:hypothetical protein
MLLVIIETVHCTLQQQDHFHHITPHLEMLSHISPLLFYFLVIVTALDNKSSNESLVTRDETVNTLSKLWDFTGCTDGQKQAIKDGLSEANKILLSSGTSDMENHWGV